jgi:hypothetical protein
MLIFIPTLFTQELDPDPAVPKRDRTGLELRKSIARRILRFSGKKSMVAKRVALWI